MVAQGRVGVSSVAAMTGVTLSQQGRAVRLVDLCGELPALFGLDEPVEGLASWSIEFEASGGDFDDLSVELDPALSMVARGLGRLRSDLLGGLFRWVESSPADVVVDAGTLWPDDESASWPTRSALVTAADLSVLVTRPCFLSMRRAMQMSTTTPLRPDCAVLVVEAGRELTRVDCERVLRVPVVAEVPVEPEIAAAVDAGTVLTRTPAAVAVELTRLVTDRSWWDRHQGWDGPEGKLYRWLRQRAV